MLVLIRLAAGHFHTPQKNKEIIPRTSVVIVTSQRLRYFLFDVADRCRTSRLLSESGFL